MNNTESKIRYTLDELKIGMKVKSVELDNIIDTWIVLENATIVQDGPFNTCWQGTVAEISKSRDTLHCTGTCVLIYNPWWENDPLISIEY